MKPIKVYLASGWFKPGEGEQEEKLYNVLKAQDWLDVFSPRRNQVKGAKCMADLPDPKDKIRQFDIDCQEIDEADIVVANYTFRDSGTIWEIGYAYKAGKPVLVLDDTKINGKKPNLMIAFCAKLGYTTNWIDFNKMLYNIIISKDYHKIDERLNCHKEVN